MKLTRFRIENFRGIESIELALDATTVLIGENNAGKSSVLEALQISMTRSLSRRAAPFNEFDFRLVKGPSGQVEAQPITLTMAFQEPASAVWPDSLVQTLDRAVQIGDDGRRSVIFRIVAQLDIAANDYTVEWSFLNIDGASLPAARQPTLVADLQQLCPVFLLTALRDAAQHFQARSQFWAPFLKNLAIPDEKRKEIEDSLALINQSVLDGHAPFAAMKAGLEKISKLTALATDPVSVEAVPSRILDMVARTQVRLTSVSGARLPLTQYGAGTQSLAVLFLFEAFLTDRLTQAFGEDTEPLLALEEPEAHLHPSAIRMLWPILEGFTGQKLIATHSGDLLAAVPLSSIRRLARKDGVVRVYQVAAGTLDQVEREKVSYHIRARRGALLFARCWLFVEGETEYVLIPELARSAGLDLDVEGVACVEYAQCPLDPLIKVAHDLGIEWHVLADGDTAGSQKVRSAQRRLDGDSPNTRITQLAAHDIEHCLWAGGYDGVYKSGVDALHAGEITARAGTSDYVTQTISAAAKSTNKPHLAYEVAKEAAKAGAVVPADLLLAINEAVGLARRSR